jgi:hypothetical protein
VPEPQRKRSSADSLMSTDWSGWRRDERRFLRSTGRSESDVTPLDFSLG